MQEHPVPQNITSYEFHLIGNMTLKQFFELAAGCMFAFLSYTSNLPDLFKWPLVFVFVILGIAFAFVPLEERPLDHWFLAFIRAIYNPTKFYWKKTIVIPDVFNYVRGVQTNTQQLESDALPRKRKRAEAFFQSISPKQTGAVEELDEKAAALLGLFQTTRVDVVDAHRREEFEKPSLEISSHNLRTAHSIPAADGAWNETSIQSGLDAVQNEEGRRLINAIYTPVDVPGGDVIAIQPSKSEIIFDSTKDVAGAEVGKQMQQSQSLQADVDLANVKTNANLPFPKTPTVPNLVVGMVLNLDGKMIEQAIIEIRDHTGMPVRALRSNRLGQFFISTPLPSDDYELSVEKDGFTFDTMKLSLTGKIVSPLEIRAK